MLSFFKINAEITFHIQLLIRMNDQHKADLDQNNEQISCEICFQETENQDERFKNFDMKKIISIFNEILAAKQCFKIHKQNFFLLLKIIQNLKSHLYKTDFMKAQQAHLESHCQMQMFYKTD